MRLEKLFDIQRKLDERIVEKHGLQGEDLFDKKILALQVELGELANEWRGFKYWSKDQKPRRKSFRWVVVEKKENSSLEQEIEYYPLLEEYVDCLHFRLSIGLELKFTTEIDIWEALPVSDVTERFLSVFYDINSIRLTKAVSKVTKDQYECLLSGFITLGVELGFTFEEIEQAYLDKNKVKDLAALKELKNLERLLLNENAVESVEDLEKMTKLKVLQFISTDRVFT